MNACIQNIHSDVVSKFTRCKNAELAAEHLSDQGFEVISVELHRRTPVVWIANSMNCKTLPGAMIGRMQTERGRLCVYAAALYECQVRWMVVGH